MRCVDLYNQAQSKWFEEMVTTSLVRHVGSLLCLFSKLDFLLSWKENDSAG